MGNLLQLPVKAKAARPARKPREQRQQIDLLAELRWLLKTARPRAKSIYLGGVRYPIRRGWSVDAVLCPATNRPLVARIAL